MKTISMKMGGGCWSVVCVCVVVCVVAMGVRRVEGHGSMLMPITRNAIDATLPAWSDGKHPETGWIEPYTCACHNGTSTCNNGQSCFWFSQGCSIGCKACTSNGARLPNFDQCPDERAAGSATNATLLKKYWTTNQNVTEGSPQDIWKFNPWRAPGKAPVSDSCGMAGGSPVEVFNAGAYNTTKFAKQGDLGSQVLPKRPSGTTWSINSTVKTRWELTAAHGGGYIYRLCPSGEPISESCFEKYPMSFATDEHTVVYADGTTEQIQATIVKEGGGIGWAQHPLPYSTTMACDYKVEEGKHCMWGCPGCKAPTWAADGACPTSCSRYPEYYNGPYTGACQATDDGLTPCQDTVHGKLQKKGHGGFVIEDSLIVPNVAPGEYVLQWRWDCEATSQVWTNCADIVIE